MKTKDLLESLELSTFTAFDFETTGLDPNNDRIIELAAIRFEYGEIVDRFVTLINPEIEIPSLITDITGISNEMVRKSPKEDSIVDDFLNFLDKYPLVAHNIHFDEQFLSRICSTHNKKENSFVKYDTLQLARSLLFEQPVFNLSALSDFYGLSALDAHRAENDTENTGLIFIELIKELACYPLELISKINSFVQIMPFGSYKYVLLDEADYMSPNGQAALRGVMEMYHTSARFILTCNYPNRVIPALHSRCQGFHIERIDQTEFTTRVAKILMDEGITPDLDILDTYVKAHYPDLRKCINTVQLNSTDTELMAPNKSDKAEADYKLEMTELFKQGKITEARKLVCSQARPDEIEDIYKWLYDNITLFGDEARQEKAILIIKKGLVDHTLVADPEINLAATMIQLQNI